jgi:hypothetical protein
MSQELLSKGRAVRALVRDVDKAKQLLVRACVVQPCSAVISNFLCDHRAWKLRLMLGVLLAMQGGLSGAAGSSLEVVAADITQPATLQPDMFVRVTAAVLASAVKVSPKEGDTPDRQKYMQVSGVRKSAHLCPHLLLCSCKRPALWHVSCSSNCHHDDFGTACCVQGIKFYDPQIVGDTPETVEYRGLHNLVTLLRQHVGLRAGQLLFAADGSVSSRASNSATL